jgi:hypothetical protein
MPSERARLIELLDQMQAADAAGASALAQWLAGCADMRLRGGLRVVQARDACHASLAAARIAALGATPSATPSRNLTALLHVLAAPGVGDRSKLAILIARFPADSDDPFQPMLGAVAADDETRALFETMADDDRLSLRWLRELGGAPTVIAVRTDGAERRRAEAHLDALAVAEAASAEVFDAWASVCRLDRLRGGLRALAAREATHAHLCVERLKALGGSQLATLSRACRDAAFAFYADGAVPDDDKLDVLFGRYPTDDDIAAPVAAMADDVPGDLETRELLRLVAAAESATLAWLRALRAGLMGAADRPANG